ncbi:MAG: hypothetical protein OXB97_10795 [Rhodospirillales bacterium]|nr:hypothetical protein [Rhodospirillales bacterium]
MTTRREQPDPLLLPYQSRWVMDPAGLKVIEKARRIGISWAEAYDAVMHAGSKRGGNVYYQAYNLEMTRGFIEDCAGWAQTLQNRAGESGETLMEEDGRAVRAFRISFASGNEILAMTSAPRAFRSKGRPGDLAIVDEAAFVDDLGEVLKAALAFRVWGGRAHVISTHNGEASPFANLCREIGEGVRPGSLHRVTLENALEEGVFRRIAETQGLPWSAAAEAEWEAALRAEYGHHASEELDCIPAAGAGAWLAWEAIRACEDPTAGDPAAFAGGTATVGVDVARRRDLWVAAVLEQVGDVLWLRELAVRQGIPFSQQRAIVGDLATRYRPVRIAVDQTGMGEAVVEQLQEDLGRSVVEGVLMTGPRRLDVATALREAVEDRRLRVPADGDLRRDLHAVRAEAGPTGAPRLLAERSGTDGHADRFWALALACTAARDGNASIEGASAGPRAAGLAGFY